MLATAEAVAAARYVHEVLPNLKSYTGINQNYAWGQDSWNDFVAAMSKLSSAKAADTPLWPKLSQGQYASEISALQLSNSELIHSSLWGSDIDSFINQGKEGYLCKQQSPSDDGRIGSCFAVRRQNAEECDCRVTGSLWFNGEGD
jgi:branched-chain amino acid transport system substrate-binding protein